MSTPFIPIGTSGRIGIGIVGTVFALVVGIENVVYGEGDTLVYLLLLLYLGLLSLPIMFLGRTTGWLHPLVVTVLFWGFVREVLPKGRLLAHGLESHLALPEADSSTLDLVVAQGLGLEILALLALYCGFAAMRSMDLVPRRLAVRTASKLIIPKVLVLALLAVGAFLVLVLAAGSWEAVFLQRGLRRDQQIYVDVDRHWHVIIGTLRLACVAWFAVKPNVAKSPVFWTLLAFGTVMYFGATGSRGGVITPFLALLCIHAYRSRKLPVPAIAVVGVGVVAALGVLGEFRAETRGAASLADVQVDARMTAALVGGIGTLTHYASEKEGLYGILGKVPHEVGHLWGESYASIATAAVPRAVWPNKPLATGRLNAQRIFERPFDGVPPGNVGEAYWNFGLVGVALVMFAWGALLRLMATSVIRNPTSSGVMVGYIVTIFTLQPNSVAFFRWLLIIVPTGLVWWWFTSRGKENQGRRPIRGERHGARMAPSEVALARRPGRLRHNPRGEAVNVYAAVGAEAYRTDLHGTARVEANRIGTFSITPSRDVRPQAPPRDGRAPEPSACVDLNRAGMDDLQRIVHIGSDRARQIVAMRPIRSVRDLQRVSGIGAARLRDVESQGLACVP